MDYTEKFTTHISLCTGYGGIDLGLGAVIPNLRTILALEIEVYAIYNMVEKIEKGFLAPFPIWTDIRTFDPKPWRGQCDIISGGFPCQPFSAAGRHQADEDPRHIFPDIKRIISEVQPELVFLENVEGIISARIKSDGWADPPGTPVLLHVIRELERIGYSCAWILSSAGEIGAPHRRRRVFLLAHRKVNGCCRGESPERWEEQDREGRAEVWIKPIGQSNNRSEEELADCNCERSQRNIFRSGASAERWETEGRLVARCSKSRGKEMEHTNKQGLEGDKQITNNGERIQQVITESGRGVAHTNSSRGGENRESNKQGAVRAIESPRRCWPARPGQHQYPWEPPRTIPGKGSRMGNTNSERFNGIDTLLREEQREDFKVAGTSSKRETLPPLGRVFDGPADRVDAPELYETVLSRNDELRLLGNGVVPAQCAKSFMILFNQLIANDFTE